MASGDTKTQQYLDIAANGTRADLPSDNCCNTRTQSLIVGVAERIMDVEDEVEELKNNPDVADIVATYADLQAYDTSKLTDKDVIRVLADETHSGDSTYYRFSKQSGTFTYIGESKQYTDFVGTDGTSAGTAGLVPAPAVADAGKFLNADGNWETMQGSVALFVEADSSYQIKMNTPLYLDEALTTQLPSNYLFDKVKNGVFFTITAINPNPDEHYWSKPTYVLLGSKEEYNFDSRNDVCYFANKGLNKWISTNATGTQITNSGNLVPSVVSSVTSSDTTNAVSPSGVYNTIYSDAAKKRLRIAADNPKNDYSIGIGLNNRTSGLGATAVGMSDNTNQNNKTLATGQYSSTFGFRGKATQMYSTAIGAYSNANNSSATALGASASATGTCAIATGYLANASGNYAVSLGFSSAASYNGSVAIGAKSATSAVGEVNVGTSDTEYGYNSTNYRLISGVHDPQNAHDAATKGYVDANAGSGPIAVYIGMSLFQAVSSVSPSSPLVLYKDAAMTQPFSASEIDSMSAGLDNIVMIYTDGSEYTERYSMNSINIDSTDLSWYIAHTNSIYFLDFGGGSHSGVVHVTVLQ